MKLVLGIKCIQFLKEDDGSRMIYLSLINQSHKIFKYKINNKRVTLDRIITIEIEGPDGMNTDANVFFVQSKDSIVIFESARAITVINEDAHIIDRFEYEFLLDDNKMNGPPFIHVSVKAYKQGALIVGSTNDSPVYDVEDIGFSVDIKNKKYNNIFKKSKFYKGWYGDINSKYFSLGMC